MCLLCVASCVVVCWSCVGRLLLVDLCLVVFSLVGCLVATCRSLPIPQDNDEYNKFGDIMDAFLTIEGHCGSATSSHLRAVTDGDVEGEEGEGRKEKKEKKEKKDEKGKEEEKENKEKKEKKEGKEKDGKKEKSKKDKKEGKEEKDAKDEKGKISDKAKSMIRLLTDMDSKIAFSLNRMKQSPLSQALREEMGTVATSIGTQRKALQDRLGNRDEDDASKEALRKAAKLQKEAKKLLKMTKSFMASDSEEGEASEKSPE